MKKQIIIFICMMAFLISPAMAADPLGNAKWWQNPKVADRLGITEMEKDALNQAFAENKRLKIDFQSKVARQRFELEEILDKEPVNQNEAMKQFAKLQKAKNALGSGQFTFLLKVRNILGQERFRQLKTLFEVYKKRLRENRRGQRRGDRRPAAERDGY